MKKEFNKIKESTCETISFDEFIDIITQGKGEQIKEDLRKLELSKKK